MTCVRLCINSTMSLDLGLAYATTLREKTYTEITDETFLLLN